ncbi:MAG: OmpP1/FadL family transporter [Panacagrimonas sp.]
MNRSAGTLLRLSLVFATGTVLAGNGLNDIGYGSESAALAGADLAVARDTFAINTNPAGLAQIKSRTFDLLLEPYAYTGNRHRDSLGNDAAPDNTYGVAAGGGYARRLTGTNLVVGAGAFAQGGAGLVYKDFITPFSETHDEISGLAGSIKIAPALAWQVNDRWSVGAALGVLYSSSRQKVFPRTSTPQFSGYRVDGLSGVSANVKVGVQYRPAPDWVIGAAYTSKAPIRLENGSVTVNNTGSGGGFVRYRDARQTGLAFAQDLGLGVLYRVNPRWSVTAEATWVDWSSVLKSTRLRATNPDDPSAPAVFSPPEAPLNWRDHTLFSFGSIYRWSPTTELRAGYSYARDPTSRDDLTPTFAINAESTIAGGIAHELNANWLLSFTAIYQIPEEDSYDSPLTGASSERWDAGGFYFTFSRRW